jgi:hypothetical protein
MKFNILLIIISTIFFGCSVSSQDDIASEKAKIDSFKKGSKLVCYNNYSTGSGRLSTVIQKDKVLVDKDTYMIINNNKNIIIKDLSFAEYEIQNCNIINEKDIFELDNGRYILLNGVAQKIKSQPEDWWIK